MQARDVDLWEISEAFAAVPLNATRKLDIDPRLRVNVNWRRSPFGTRSARPRPTLIGTALDELESAGKRPR